MSLLWPPITTPQLGGVIEVTFFEKMIRCGAREKTNIWRPWHQELWKRLRWIGILVNWGCFLQNYELLLGQYSKISNQWNFLEKDTNFCWIFYLMPALHKTSLKILFRTMMSQKNLKCDYHKSLWQITGKFRAKPNPGLILTSKIVFLEIWIMSIKTGPGRPGISEIWGIIIRHHFDHTYMIDKRK